MAAAACYCEMGKRGIRILEYRSLDCLAVIPETIDGIPVTELAPYLFSVHENYNDTPHPDTFWWSEEEGKVPAEAIQDLPKLKGERLEELHLPLSLQRVGAYALYNCQSLRKIELSSTTLDWGAGVFTGCFGVKELVVHVDESRRSCLKEVLAELRQTLSVVYDGPQMAKLIFSEFFEEAVENTPARILVTNTHGCGLKYRNAFVQTQFQFREYDSLFLHVQVQEPEELVERLALGRVMYPYHLTEEYRENYVNYLREHRVHGACQAVMREDMEQLKWLTEHIDYGAEDLRQVIETANRKNDMTAVSFLMEKIHGQGNVRRKRFSL